MDGSCNMSFTLHDPVFPIYVFPDKSADTIVSTFINHYLPVHMYPRYILSDNGTEFKNQLMDQVLQQLCINHILFLPYHPPEEWEIGKIPQISKIHIIHSLIFHMQVVSVMFNRNNPVSGSPFKIPFSWLFILKIHSFP